MQLKWTISLSAAITVVFSSKVLLYLTLNLLSDSWKWLPFSLVVKISSISTLCGSLFLTLFWYTTPVTNLTTEAFQVARWFCYGKFCVDQHARHIFNSFFDEVLHICRIELVDFDIDSWETKINKVFPRSWEVFRTYQLNFLKQQLQVYWLQFFFKKLWLCVFIECLKPFWNSHWLLFRVPLLMGR